MAYNIHDTLVAIYDAIQEIPNRPDVLIFPNDQTADTSKKPYWRVSFLGTTTIQTYATGESRVSFLVQIDLVVESGAQSKELDEFTETLWDCFPEGAEFLGARVRRTPDTAELGVEGNNSGYRRVMTVNFVATITKALKYKGGLNG